MGLQDQSPSQETPIYQIRFRGQLDKRHTAWFDEMQVTSVSNNETVIEGKVQDQSALFGIINRLRDLNLELLEVRQIKQE